VKQEALVLVSSNMATLSREVTLVGLAVAAAFFLAMLQVREAQAAEVGYEQCLWVGHSPFCFGNCPDGYQEIRRARKDPAYSDVSQPFGRNCLTGTKKLCCAQKKRAQATLPSPIKPEGGNRPDFLLPGQVKDTDKIFGEGGDFDKSKEDEDKKKVPSPFGKGPGSSGGFGGFKEPGFPQTGPSDGFSGNKKDDATNPFASLGGGFGGKPISNDKDDKFSQEKQPAVLPAVGKGNKGDDRDEAKRPQFGFGPERPFGGPGGIKEPDFPSSSSFGGATNGRPAAGVQDQLDGGSFPQFPGSGTGAGDNKKEPKELVFNEGKEDRLLGPQGQPQRPPLTRPSFPSSGGGGSDGSRPERPSSDGNNGGNRPGSNNSRGPPIMFPQFEEQGRDFGDRGQRRVPF
jgi:hypothetical protein